MRSAVEHESAAQGTELQLGVGVLDVRGLKCSLQRRIVSKLTESSRGRKSLVHGVQKD